MELKKDWFMEPVIDFELKKYQLLAYLQNKKEELSAQKLFPNHFELVEKYLALEEVIKNKSHVENSLMRELKKIDWKNLRLIYKKEDYSTEKIDELMDIIMFAFPKINSCRLDFKEEIEKLKNEIQMDVVGILPSYLTEGFIILEQPSGYYLFTYEMQSVLDLQGEKRFVHEYLTTYKNRILNTPISIKKDIISTHKDKMPNPAVFIASCTSEIPIYETLLPISGWALQKFVA